MSIEVGTLLHQELSQKKMAKTVSKLDKFLVDVDAKDGKNDLDFNDDGLNDEFNIEGKPLLFDSENPKSTLCCPVCDVKGINCTLLWHEFDYLVKKKKCKHCGLPLPKERDYVSCDNGHKYCLYCVELMLFRVQLALFVHNKNEDNLHKEWEKDYCKRTTKHKRNQSNMSGTFHFGKSLAFGSSIRATVFGGKHAGDDDDEIKDNKGSCLDCFQPNKDNESKNGNFSTLKKDDSKNEESLMKTDSFAKTDSIFDMGNDGNIAINDDQKQSQQVVAKPVAVALLIKRLDQGPNVKLPPGIIHLDYEKYGVYCMSYIFSKLESKQRAKLFMILEFICMVQPTATTIKLISEYKKGILMFPKKHIDNMFLAVIRGSKYSICAALKMSSIAKIMGKIDLAQMESFMELSKKYEGIAVEIIKEIESHHLATILLETPSDIDEQSPLEMAFDYELYNFLSQGKVQKITTQIWHKNDFLKPKNSFEEQEWHLWDTLKCVVMQPRNFFFQPFGKRFLQAGAYAGYILLFTLILAILRPTLYDDMGYIEIIFWYLSLGYVGYEFYDAFFETGVSSYLVEWTNYMDLVICINLTIVFAIRAAFVFNPDFHACDTATDGGRLADWNYNTGIEFAEYARCPTSHQIASAYWNSVDSRCEFWEKYNEVFPMSSYTGTLGYTNSSTLFDTICDYNRNDYFFDTSDDGKFYVCDCWYILDKYMEQSCCRQLDEPEAIIYNFLLGITAIVFWARVLYFYESHRRLGPLLKVIGQMIDDTLNYLFISFLLLIGFGLALLSLIGDWSGNFREITATGLYMFQSVFMKIDFKVLSACGESESDLCSDGGWLSEWRSSLAQILMCVYLVIALCMIRILVAMFAATYNRSIKQSKYQVMYARLKQAYELDRSSGLIAPPLNIIAFTIALIWAVCDLSLLLLINRYIDIENIRYASEHLEEAPEIERVDSGQPDNAALDAASVRNYFKENVIEGKFFQVKTFSLTLTKPEGDSYFKRVYKGIRLLLGEKDGDKWICNYCRTPNRDSMRYPIEAYLEQFSPRNDEADEKVIKVYSPHICQTCFRNKYPVWRSQIVLREISFFIFMVVCWPIIVLLTFIPALFSKLREIVTELAISQDQEDEIKEQQLENNMTMSMTMKKGRQIAQMEYQWRSNPDTYYMEHQKGMRKNLRYIITTTKTSDDSLITPNINKIVDNVITDNTPLKKVQIRIEDLYSLVQNSTKMQLAQIKENLMAGQISGKAGKAPNDDDIKRDDTNDDDDDDPPPNMPLDRLMSVENENGQMKKPKTLREQYKTEAQQGSTGTKAPVNFGENLDTNELKGDELLTTMLKTEAALKNTQNSENDPSIIDDAVKDKLFVNKIESDAQKHHRLYKQKSMLKRQRTANKQNKLLNDDDTKDNNNNNNNNSNDNNDNNDSVAIDLNASSDNTDDNQIVGLRDGNDAP